MEIEDEKKIITRQTCYDTHRRVWMGLTDWLQTAKNITNYQQNEKKINWLPTKLEKNTDYGQKRN